jgi:hypothetical protein
VDPKHIPGPGSKRRLAELGVRPRTETGEFRARTPILDLPDPFPCEEIRTEGLPFHKLGSSAAGVVVRKSTLRGFDGPAPRQDSGAWFSRLVQIHDTTIERLPSRATG